MTEIQTEISGLETTVGKVLKSTRLEKKLTKEQVAKQLNLSVYTIRDLENDNYDELPVMTYVRGYIVSYCRILGLDSFEVLSHLNTPDSSKKKSSVEHLQSNNNKSRSLFSSKKLFILFLITASALGIKQLLPLLNKDSSLETDIVNNSTDKLTESTENIQEVVQNTTDVSEPLNELTSTELKNKIELSFESVSWVDIQSKDKEKIVYKSFATGETHTVKAELPLNIFIDNASAVSLTYEGEKVDLEQYIKDGYAKFTLEK